MALCFKSLTKRYIFQLTKCEHKGVSKSIAFDGRFPAWSLIKFLIFLNLNILFPEYSKEDRELYFRYFDAIWTYIVFL